MTWTSEPTPTPPSTSASGQRRATADQTTARNQATPRNYMTNRAVIRPRVPGLVVLYHPELARVGQRALLGGLASGVPAELSRNTPVFGGDEPAESGPLRDGHLSRHPLVLTSDGEGGVYIDTDASRVPYTLHGQPGGDSAHVTAEMLDRGLLLGLGGRVLLLLGRFALRGQAQPNHGLQGISDATEQTRADITHLAKLDVPVLIRGETGSGKERVARAIHAASSRKDKPFVALNMAAIAPSAATSELFGHKRGAFTDAVANHLGHFGAADGGTLFLDEIGETPLAVQTLLLRALDEGHIQPVGGQPRTVNVRLLAATDADLEQAVADGQFRETLLHRIAVCTIDVPPLRRRREEVPVLLLHFLRAQLTTLGVAQGSIRRRRVQSRG